MHSENNAAKNVPDIEWNWEQANYFAEWHEPIYSLLERYVPASSKILEVGGGGSHTLGALAARLNCTAFGIDPDRNGAAKTKLLAEAESAKVEMIRGDGFCLPFDDGEFDVVYSLGLVEHFSALQTDELVAEHVRVCRPGGLVIVAVPNSLNLPHTARKALLGSRYEYFPERSYSPNQLGRLLRKSGLRIVSMDGVVPLWGLGMSPMGWRVVTVLNRIGIGERLNNVGNSRWRAALGFITYAVAVK